MYGEFFLHLFKRVSFYCFLTSLPLFFSAFFIARKKKPLLEDIYYAFFWLFGGLFWLASTFIMYFDRTGNTVLRDAATRMSFLWVPLHISFGLAYVLAKVTTNRVVNFLFWVISSFLFIYNLFFIIPYLRYSPSRPGAAYYETPGKIPHGYVFSGIIIATLPLIGVIIYKDVKRGRLSFSNLSQLYALWAIVIYAAMSVSQTLYINISPFAWLVTVTSVPYLIYLAYRNQS